MQNIDEVLAALTFPEPTPPAEPEAAPVAEAVSVPEAVSPVVGETAPVVDVPAGEKTASAKKDAKKSVEKEEDDEHAKDGVSLDDLFSMKPEIFQTAPAADDADDKKKGKKGKKKSVALEFDEERGEVVARKVHKRGGETWEEE